jgi:hypothetical protein
LKIVSLKYWRGTVFLALASALVYSTVHYPDGYYTSIWAKLHEHYTSHAPWLMPTDGNWFSGLPGMLKRACF